MSDTNHQAEQSLALAFTLNEWGLIRTGLYELPAKVSVPLIGKLERQFAEVAQQQQAKSRETTS